MTYAKYYTPRIKLTVFELYDYHHVMKEISHLYDRGIELCTVIYDN